MFSDADRMTASLDNQPLAIHPGTSESFFAFQARANSTTGFPPGTHEAVAWGEWVGPIPLPAGQHVLRFRATAGTFRLDVTYDLTVQNSA